MKLNNYGWGLKELIMFLCGLALCLLVTTVLYHRLAHGKSELSNTPSIFSGETDKSINSYIELEDKMAEAAKGYKISNENDTIIIKLSTLIKNNYINVIYDPQSNRECSGYVIYTGGTKKDYKAYLSCAGHYQTSDYDANFE